MGYTIDKIAWHTQQPHEPEPFEVMAEQFWHAVRFLQENGLTTRDLATSTSDLDEEFEIHTDDLTSEGLALMKAAYEKWVRRVERGMAAEDTAILAQALARLRQSS